MLKTAVIGASGFIGHHLWNAYRESFPDCVGTGFSTFDPTLSYFDVREPDLASLRLEKTGHHSVIIASAKTSIAFCEKNRAEAYAVNVEGTLELVQQIGRTSLQLIFLSSDYVFQGTAGQYDDDAETNPTTEYGRQKMRVEKEIPSLTDNYLILRLSKVFGIKKSDGTLLDEMASALASGREVLAARDQFFCPTYVADLVRAIHAIQGRTLRGIMNVCPPERYSRYEIAGAVAEAMQASAASVKPISLHELPSMARRPLNTSMVCTRFTREVEFSFIPLRDCITRVAANWKGA